MPVTHGSRLGQGHAPKLRISGDFSILIQRKAPKSRMADNASTTAVELF